MEQIIKIWLIGIEIIFVWKSLIQSIASFSKGNFTGGVFYLLLGVFVLILSFAGVFTKMLKNSNVSVVMIMTTMGGLTVLFLFQSIVLLQFGNLNTAPTAGGSISSFGAYSSFVITLFFFLYEIYLVQQK